MPNFNFSKQLLEWFDLHGRKHLPWQENKTPYRVWISEIMLQQTQVVTVIDYFNRFMQRFPDVNALAVAPIDEVMHLWAGLGYYSRVRNLHRAAQMIMQTFAGIFPSDLIQLQQLPGIGPSTAGAIAAIAFNQPTAILDGNVKRVLARFYAITKPINDKNTEILLWQHAKTHTPIKRVADYTQAIMDLGATICTRSSPRCPECPLRKKCAGYQQGIAQTLPIKTASKKLPVKQATFLMLHHEDKILLQKRAPVGIWGGLWSFPEMADTPDEAAVMAFCHSKYQCQVIEYLPLTPFRHTFTHYHLDIHPIKLVVKKQTRKIMDADDQIWYNPEQPAKLGLPKPIQSIIRGMK